LTNVQRGIVLVAGGLVALLAGGCGGNSSAPKGDAPALLRRAKSVVDAAPSAHFTLTSQGVSGQSTDIVSGSGDLVRPDQLKGSFTVSIRGLQADVRVVSTGGVFEALLPFQSHYERTNPADFGLTDPSQLLEPSHGLSSLLTIATGPQLTGQKRLTGELLDEISATVPGSDIPVLPDANPSKPVALVAAIDPGNFQLRQVTLTGPFTSPSNSTFVVTLTKYGETVPITLPST
jgi:lipoprotein LprG